MVDLSLETSREFWKNFTDPGVFQVINIMEKIETWTLDGHDSIEAALTQLESALDLAEGTEITQYNKLIYLGAYLKTSRVLKLMQEIDTSCPGAASRLLSHAESADDNKVAQLFIRRNLIFERLRILSRIFSSKNLQVIQEALEDHS
ncbi:type IVB secretion system protein IcmW [Gammaproteobacteria bacterium]|nr:type IVB secretion system protein IcmW [Gammaproteobacteria bacterium]